MEAERAARGADARRSSITTLRHLCPRPAFRELNAVESPSKSARKRDAKAVEALAVRLVEASPDELDRLPLGEELRRLVAETRAIGSRQAARRQRLYLAKRLRREDTGPLAAAFEELDRERGGERRLFHEAEAWRDRLLEEGRDAAMRFAARTGRENAAIDRLLAEYRPAAAERERKRIGRELFRQVHAELERTLQSETEAG